MKARRGGRRRACSQRIYLVPVIPAKAGIQTIEAKPAARNQIQIASDKSLPPLWAGMGRFIETKSKLKPTGPFPLYG